MKSASACAKTILFGEHAVVYGEPAIAIPLIHTRTYVSIHPTGNEFRIISKSAHLNRRFEDLRRESGLYQLLLLIKKEFSLSSLPNAVMKISSNIPIASGLGSGAALSTAIIRAFAAFCGKQPGKDEINQMVYEIEKIYHGTPSGIDNTVIVYEQPLIFIKGSGFTPIEIDPGKLPLLVADSGIRSRTVDAVNDVRDHYDRNEPYIHQIGDLVKEAVHALDNSDLTEIGRIMNETQKLLQSIDVSCPELDELTSIALQNGAYGAKLTGAGRGGNFIVLCRDEQHSKKMRSIYEERRIHVIQ